ncbi:hypothetical protein BS78_04G308200 [Paspalum vaginatum]|nr:hypothetical protein BS78_04G308200 [Paspalum vaginatum]
MASASCSAAAGRGGPRPAAAPGNAKKLMTCLCSPTSHPGSFRCSRHRNASSPGGGGEAGPRPRQSRGSRAAASKGRSVRALLLQRISGPGERGRQRRQQGGDFQPRPSRLRLMNK